MHEPRRLASAPAGEIERHSRTEALLVEGLDCYFAGRYEDAIHIWTRVLFLDRTHARARAYIDRARGALAEHQRQTDEMLQASQDLLDQGETAAARHLLTEAVAAMGEDDRAVAVRARLERVERAHAASRVASRSRVSAPEPVAGWEWQPTSRRLFGGLAALALLAMVLLAAASPAVQDWLGLGPGRTGAAVSSPSPRIAAIGSAETALVRARTLYTWGRLPEALQALDRVPADSTSRAAADALRVEIQRLLLAGSRASAGAPDTSEPRR